MTNAYGDESFMRWWIKVSCSRATGHSIFPQHAIIRLVTRMCPATAYRYGVSSDFLSPIDVAISVAPPAHVMAVNSQPTGVIPIVKTIKTTMTTAYGLESLIFRRRKLTILMAPSADNRSIRTQSADVLSTATYSHESRYGSGRRSKCGPRHRRKRRGR